MESEPRTYGLRADAASAVSAGLYPAAQGMRDRRQSTPSNRRGRWHFPPGTKNVRQPAPTMKTKSRLQPDHFPMLREDDIRSYAEHLYDQGGRQPGHDLDNWLEAEACLRSHLPPSRAELRRHLPPAARRRARGFTMPACDASVWEGEGGRG